MTTETNEIMDAVTTLLTKHGAAVQHTGQVALAIAISNGCSSIASSLRQLASAVTNAAQTISYRMR